MYYVVVCRRLFGNVVLDELGRRSLGLVLRLGRTDIVLVVVTLRTSLLVGRWWALIFAATATATAASWLVFGIEIVAIVGLLRATLLLFALLRVGGVRTARLARHLFGHIVAVFWRTSLLVRIHACPVTRRLLATTAAATARCFLRFGRGLWWPVRFFTLCV